MTPRLIQMTGAVSAQLRRLRLWDDVFKLSVVILMELSCSLALQRGDHFRPL